MATSSTRKIAESFKGAAQMTPELATYLMRMRSLYRRMDTSTIDEADALLDEVEKECPQINMSKELDDAFFQLSTKVKDMRIQLVNELRSMNTNLRASLVKAEEKIETGGKLLAQHKKGPIEIVLKTEKGKKVGHIKRAHYMMPALLRRVKMRVHVYLVGPAGSGKTKAAEMVADSLGLRFNFISIGPQTQESKLMGYVSPIDGKYYGTGFRDAWEKGGVYLIDEMDKGNAGILTCLNAALAGDLCSFPDKVVRKHKDFVCIAAGNTFGTGPDRVYCGSQELDGSSIDRLDFLEWPYDEGLEMVIAEEIDKKWAKVWVPYVQSVRAAIQRLGIQLVVSPRCSFGGIKLLLDGEDRESVERTSLWKSAKPDEVNRILENVKQHQVAA